MKSNPSTEPLPGVQIKAIRESMGRSQVDFGLLLDAHVQTIHRWEHEKMGGSKDQPVSGLTALVLRNLSVMIALDSNEEDRAKLFSDIPPEEVEKRRKGHGLSQAALATLFGLSGPSVVSRWETGKTACTGLSAYAMRHLDFFMTSYNAPEDRRAPDEPKASKTQVIEALEESESLDEAALRLDVHRRTLNRYLNRYAINKKELLEEQTRTQP